MPNRRETLRRCRQRVRLHELLLQTPTIAPPDRGQLRSVCAAGRMHTKMRGRSDAQQHKPLRILILFFSGGNFCGDDAHKLLRKIFSFTNRTHKIFREACATDRTNTIYPISVLTIPAAIVQNRYRLPNICFARAETTCKTERDTMFSLIE